jgi:hypothetical protein
MDLAGKFPARCATPGESDREARSQAIDDWKRNSKPQQRDRRPWTAISLLEAPLEFGDRILLRR